MPECAHEFQDAPFVLHANMPRPPGRTKLSQEVAIKPQLCAKCGVLRIDPQTLPKRP